MKTGLVTTTETITPEDADRYLKLNLNNRPLSVRRATALAETIKRNEWKLTGESIKFCRDGYLLDGQHRLYACIIAKMPITTCVTRGVAKESFVAMDLGGNRSAADTLAIKGVKNYKRVASAIRIAMAVERNPKNPNFGDGFTPQQVEKYLYTNKNIETYVTLARTRDSIGDNPIVVGLVYLFSKKNEPLAKTFLERLIDGAELVKHHPIMTLRDRLIQNKASMAKLPRKIVAIFVIKAWNAYRANASLKIMRHQDDENFPQIS